MLWCSFYCTYVVWDLLTICNLLLIIFCKILENTKVLSSSILFIFFGDQFPQLKCHLILYNCPLGTSVTQEAEETKGHLGGKALWFTHVDSTGLPCQQLSPDLFSSSIFIPWTGGLTVIRNLTTYWRCADLQGNFTWHNLH